MSSRKFKTICQVIASLPERQSKFPAVQNKENHGWQDYSWLEYYDKIETVACALLDLGVQPEDRVAIMSNTRFEWSQCDFAIMGLGAITVPIYQTLTADELKFILNNSKARFLFVENSSTLKTFNEVCEQCPSVEKVISLTSLSETAEDRLSWNDFLARGQQGKSEHKKIFSSRCLQATPTDTATILYTSGTTGTPKGVVLTHEQIISEVSEAFTHVGVYDDDKMLTFLPYAHILGRIEQWGHVYFGLTLSYAESIDRVRANLLEVRPTIMVAVPRIFEKVYAAIHSQIEHNPVTGKLFRWAVDIGKQAGDYRLKRKSVPLDLLLKFQLADRLVLHKVRDVFGGQLRFAISGGAPMARDIALFFHACGVLVLEGYGLTETTAAICVNTPYNYRFGSVGTPIGDVQLKIADDGEILVKSKKVMKEYYLDPQATKEAFTDGWYHTGDIGEILPSGDLKITDRKKDLIKTAGGKYVAPQRLENLLKLNPFIANVLIHGDQKKYIVALITLDTPSILKFAKERNITYKDYDSLTQHPAVLEMVRKGVAEANAHLASFETIKRFSILPRDFTVEGGELTPSLKVKRKVLDKKYADQIEALYN
jgi:long-chain acyl-CoA synthetase